MGHVLQWDWIMCSKCVIYFRFNDEGLHDHLLTRKRSFTFLASSKVCIRTLFLNYGMTVCMSICRSMLDLSGVWQDLLLIMGQVLQWDWIMCSKCVIYSRFNDEGLRDCLLTRKRSFTFLASSKVCISTLLLNCGMTICMSIGNCWSDETIPNPVPPTNASVM